MPTQPQIIADRLGHVKPSASVAAKARADAMRAAGRDIMDFTLGEPDFPTPAHIVRAGMAALESGHTRYTASAGTPALRRAIAGKLKRENGLEFGMDEIVVGSGAKHVIFNALMATVNAGDEVIVPAPYWVSYPEMVLINGGVPVAVQCPAAAGFKLTGAQLQAAITERTRWVILNTPSNPTGAVYDRAELRELADVLLGNPHVSVLTDEIYEHFVYGDARHACILDIEPELRSRTLLVNGLSKSHAMTGWRIGYGCGPAALIKAITLLITQSTTCATAAAQAAAVEALEGPQQCVGEAAARFQERRDCIVKRLNAIDGITCDSPDGAFYVFACVAGLLGRRTPQGQILNTDVDVADFLREEAGVVAIDGSSYGMSPFLRFSFATSMNEIYRGCNGIEAACARLASSNP